MARIPQYDGPQVRDNPLSGGAQTIQTSAADFGVGVSQAVQNVGAIGQQESEVWQRRAVIKQAEDDKAQAWTAYTTLSEKIRTYQYDPQTGVLNRQGADALGMTDESSARIGAWAKEINGTLVNKEQQRLFKETYQRRVDADLTGIARHESAQRQVWLAQVSKGVIETAASDAALNWTNPKLIESNIELADTALVGALKQRGTPTELIQSESAKLKSGIWRQVVEHAVQYDPDRANVILGARRDQMTGQDAAAMDRLIEAPLRAAKARTIANGATAMVASSSTVPAPVAAKINAAATADGVDPTVAMTIASLESQGDPAAKNGKSSAHGVFQFVDNTWEGMGGGDRNDVDKQVANGTKYIKQNTDGLRSKLGRDPAGWEVYLAHQQGLGGATALLSADPGEPAVTALAKVLKKPGAAEEAIVNNGGKADMTVSEFVGLWEKKYTARAGAVARSADPSSDEGPTLAETLAQVDALAGGDLELREEARSKAIAQFNQRKAVQKEARDDALDRVLNHVEQVGTLDGVKPADLVMLTPQQQRSVRATLKERSKVITDQSYQAGLYSMTDKQLADSDPVEAMKKLDEGDYKTYLTMRKAARSGDADGKLTQVRTANGIATDTLEKIGIKIGTKAGEDDRVKSEAFYKGFASQLHAFEIQKGGKANNDEIQAVADRMAQKVVFDPPGLGNAVDVRRFEFTLDKVPPNYQTSIRAEGTSPEGLAKISALLGRKVTEVNDAVIIDLYAALQMKKYGPEAK